MNGNKIVISLLVVTYIMCCVSMLHDFQIYPKNEFDISINIISMFCIVSCGILFYSAIREFINNGKDDE